MFFGQQTAKSEVKDQESRAFQYLKVGNEGRQYFCLQQKISVLLWMLYWKKDIFRPIERTHPKKLSFRLAINWLQSNYRLLRKNLKFLLIVVLHKLQLRNTDSMVILPVYGQTCLAVHKGYKVFNLCKGIVVKVFDQDCNSSSIMNEIKILEKVSSIDFAPSLKKWNLKEKWYEEDYVSGSLDSSYKPLDSVALIEKFKHELVPHIHSLILFQPSKIKTSVEYIKEIIEISGAPRLSSQEFPVTEFIKIQTFLDAKVERLRIEGNCPVYLVFTHGDFCPANMLNAPHGIRIVDWENAGYRSALFDFYSYFFYRPVARKIPVNTIVSEINETFPFFVSSLTRKAPDFSPSLLSLRETYRWLYYIERICMLVERMATDRNLNILDEILRYIQAFNRYEEILASENTGPECGEFS